MSTDKIVVEAVVANNLEQAWNCWTAPEHIVNWSFASEDWHCPAASNDLRVGGKFASTMAAKDGSMSFEFSGVYTEVEAHHKLAYSLGDERVVEVVFEEVEGGVKVTESFVPENTHPREMQQAGWQSILNNYKKYAESLSNA